VSFALVSVAGTPVMSQQKCNWRFQLSICVARSDTISKSRKIEYLLHRSRIARVYVHLPEMPPRLVVILITPRFPAELVVDFCLGIILREPLRPVKAQLGVLVIAPDSTKRKRLPAFLRGYTTIYSAAGRTAASFSRAGWSHQKFPVCL